MEEKKLNEKESLELIAQMIQNSKKNLQLGSGNMFLLWGYLSASVALVVYALVLLTGNQVWNVVWFAIPLIGCSVSYWQMKKESTPILTYTDKVLKMIWKVNGEYGGGLCLLCCLYYNTLSFLPSIILILCSLSTCLTAHILNDKFMRNCSGAGIGIGVVLLSQALESSHYNYSQYIGFAVAFIIMMVIPGHRLNNEARRLCSKN